MENVFLTALEDVCNQQVKAYYWCHKEVINSYYLRQVSSPTCFACE